MKRTRTPKYYFGGLGFNSKAAVTKYIQSEILYAYEDRQPVSPGHFAFLLDLLKSHKRSSQKIGCGIAAIWSQPNPLYHNNRGFWLRRTDGTETDFSFYQCLSPTTNAKDALSALRSAIRPQIDEFRTEAFRATDRLICPVTGDTVMLGNHHVDHATPFQKLVDAWLAEQQLTLEKIDVDPHGDGDIEDRITDPALAASWAAFHRAYARLRIVTREANLSILRRGNNGPSEVADG